MSTPDQTETAPAPTEEQPSPEGVLAVRENAEVEQPPEGRKRHTLRRSLLLLTAITVVAAAGAAATGAFGGDDDSAAPAASAGPAKTTKVQRTTLTRTETVDGNLGFGKPTTVQDSAGGTGGTGSSAGDAQNGQSSQPAQGGASGGSSGGGDSGIVTWLPSEGDVIKRGETAYSVDQKEIPLLYGPTPLYRTLKSGTEGKDVEMLERNLAKLGYTGFTVDDTYTSGTAAAVQDWQDDLNRDETGTVEPGDAVVADGARRVAELKTSPGSVSGGEVLTWTGTERIVTVDLDAQYEDLVDEGTEATVELPDDATAKAKVTDVGTAATPGGEASGGAGESEGSGGSDGKADEATLPVELKVEDQGKLGRYQAASVDVVLKAETRKNVLTVPVNALMARPGGGYAVQTKGPDGIEYRPVKLGMFANGLVEVEGDGIREGLAVGVPK